MKLWLRGNIAAALVFVGLIILWEVVCRLAKVPVWLLPSPGQIATAMWSSKDILPVHIFTTTWEVLAGFGVAVGVGIPLSILIVFSDFSRKLIYPFLVVLQSVPKVALAPIMLLWIGYGTSSKILIAAVTALQPKLRQSARPAPPVKKSDCSALPLRGGSHCGDRPYCPAGRSCRPYRGSAAIHRVLPAR